jgi:hypothetical protein
MIDPDLYCNPPLTPPKQVMIHNLSKIFKKVT